MWQRIEKNESIEKERDKFHLMSFAYVEILPFIQKIECFA